jgi:hypothetical protein
MEGVLELLLSNINELRTTSQSMVGLGIEKSLISSNTDEVLSEKAKKE